MLCYSLNNLLNHGSLNNYITPEAASLLTPSELSEIVNNMKWVFAQEHLVLAVLWSSKTVMLIIYWRITLVFSHRAQRNTADPQNSEGLKSRRWIFVPAAYAIMTFVGSEFALFFSCYPTRRRWDVPSNSRKHTSGIDTMHHLLTFLLLVNCSHYVHYQLILAILNISSSFIILAIGMPIIISLRLAPRQKWIVTIMFGLGAFDIIASALKANCTLHVTLYGFAFLSWYMRESTVALLVCNVPFAWSLLSDTFPRLKDWAQNKDVTLSSNFWPGSRSSSPILNRLSGLATKGSWSGSSFTERSSKRTSKTESTSNESDKTMLGRSDSPLEKSHLKVETSEFCEKAATVTHTSVRPGSVAFVNVEKVASKDFAREIDLERGDRRSWSENRRSSLVTAIDDEAENIWTVLEEDEESMPKDMKI